MTAAEKTEAVSLVQLPMCGPCLNGAGGECHTPGCAMWMMPAPSSPVLGRPLVVVLDGTDPAVKLAAAVTERDEAWAAHDEVTRQCAEVFAGLDRFRQSVAEQAWEREADESGTVGVKFRDVTNEARQIRRVHAAALRKLVGDSE